MLPAVTASSDASIENTRKMTSETGGPGLAPGLIGTVLSGRYRLDSKLGSGGMSTVYLARDETLERWIAVKILHREISDDPDQIERFRREARSVAQLSHPNIVAVIDAGEDGGHPYIVFEYVAGRTLKERIERLGRLPLDEAVAYAIEIGRGLASAHGRKLVHRDVKPQNVLIDPEGRAKVTDFGIARSLESDGLTKTGRVLGTTDYVSPEQAMGTEVDARSDVYSLGILLYEMLTGKVPFEAETVVGVAMKHVNERMPDVQLERPEVSSALAAAIERATSKNPDSRYDDMNAFLADLEGALEIEVARAGSSHGEATTVLKTVSGPRKLLTGRTVSVAGIALVLAATVAALLIAAFTGGSEHATSGGGGTPGGSPINLVSARDFDPDGTGGEHPEDVKLAIDGNPDTPWTTEEYSSPNFEDVGKTGVGLIVDAGKPVAARSIRLRSAAGGWDVQIYGTSTTPPTTAPPTGWGPPLGSASKVSPDETVQLTATHPSQYYLVWITKPAPDGPPYSVELDEVTLLT
jgi:eukaryotic-like serine/threonine-protein kinase